MNMSRKRIFMKYQVIIPGNLSEERYISGIHALNLTPPENTSGDWHFSNVFYHEKNNVVITLAGNGENINSNLIFGNYGIYDCTETLKKRGLKANGNVSYAANHFRAILDLLYERIKEGKYPSYLQGMSEDFLDTESEKEILLEKAEMMLPFLSLEEQEILLKWIGKERIPGYRA
jgi:hypothetical protein